MGLVREEGRAWASCPLPLLPRPHSENPAPPSTRGHSSSWACHVHRPCGQHVQVLWVSTACSSEPQFSHLHRDDLT